MRRADEIIADLGRIAALRDLVKAKDTDLRAELQQVADQMQDLSGASFNAPVKGVGRAYITAPSDIPRITDPDAFAAFLLAEFGEGAVQTVAYLDRSLVEQAAATDPALRQALEDHGCYGVREVWSESAPLDAIGRCERNDAGELFSASTGQAAGITFVPASKPTLTVKIDDTFKTQAKRALLSAFEPALLSHPAAPPDGDLAQGSVRGLAEGASAPSAPPEAVL